MRRDLKIREEWNALKANSVGFTIVWFFGIFDDLAYRYREAVFLCVERLRLRHIGGTQPHDVLFVQRSLKSALPSLCYWGLKHDL